MQGPSPHLAAPARPRSASLPVPADLPEAPVPWEAPHNRALRFWVPVGALAVGILIAALLTASPARLWSFLAVYHAPLGAYTAVPTARALGFSALFLLVFMAYLRIVGALFFVWNMHWLRGLPWLGKHVAHAERKGRAAWARHPWLRRAGFVGLALFVFIPFVGTGLVTGSVVGRLSGFAWFPAWTAITLGALAQLLALVLLVYAGWTFLPF